MPAPGFKTSKIIQISTAGFAIQLFSDVLRTYSCQLPQRKIVSDFCLFPTLRADICVPVSGGIGQCGAFGSC